jgi:hypothetical protein
MGKIFTKARRKKFLDALALGYSISYACKKLKIGRQTAYDLKKKDEEFAGAWEEAVEQGTEALEDEAVTRAYNGSDTMLIFTLKARKPEKYGDKKHITGDFNTNNRHELAPELDAMLTAVNEGEFEDDEEE